MLKRKKQVKLGMRLKTIFGTLKRWFIKPIMLPFPLIQYLAFKDSSFPSLCLWIKRLFDLWYWILLACYPLIYICVYIWLRICLYTLYMLAFVYLNKAGPKEAWGRLEGPLSHLYKLRMTFSIKLNTIMVKIKAYMVAKIHRVNNQTWGSIFLSFSSLLVSENEMTIIRE